MLDRPRYVARYEWIRKKGMSGHIDYITRNANLQFRKFFDSGTERGLSHYAGWVA